MFRNLSIEMARNGLTAKDVSRMVGMDYNTLLNKLNGKMEFTCGEAVKIRNVAFAGLTLEYLFGNEQNAGDTTKGELTY